MKGFNVLQLKLYWSQTHEIKGKCKFNLYFIFQIINTNNRSQRLFFLPLLNPRFHRGNLPKIFNQPYASQKTVCSRQNLFFLQNKELNNSIRVDRHVKKQFKVFKLESNTLPYLQKQILAVFQQMSVKYLPFPHQCGNDQRSGSKQGAHLFLYRKC